LVWAWVPEFEKLGLGPRWEIILSVLEEGKKLPCSGCCMKKAEPKTLRHCTSGMVGAQEGINSPELGHPRHLAEVAQ
jgi:hypothetical protein